MSETHVVDARGLTCPGPITKVVKVYKLAKNGDLIEVLATDPGFIFDINAWIEKTGNQLLELKREGEVIKALIKVTAKK